MGPIFQSYCFDLPVMYIGLKSCVSLCFIFGMVVNKFTAWMVVNKFAIGGFPINLVYNFDLAKQSSVNSHVPSRLTWPLRCSPTWLLWCSARLGWNCIKLALYGLSNFGAAPTSNIFHLNSKLASRLCSDFHEINKDPNNTNRIWNFLTEMPQEILKNGSWNEWSSQMPTQ